MCAELKVCMLKLNLHSTNIQLLVEFTAAEITSSRTKGQQSCPTVPTSSICCSNLVLQVKLVARVYCLAKHLVKMLDQKHLLKQILLFTERSLQTALRAYRLLVFSYENQLHLGF